MKKILFTLGIAIASYSSLFAQWTNPVSGISYTPDKVGIGTINPHANLSLSNDLTPQKFLLYDLNYVRYGFGIQPAELRQFSGSSGHISFGMVSESDGSTWSEKMRIDNTGYVGIGTSTPATKTEIAGAGTTQISLLRLNATGGPAVGQGGAIEFGSQVNAASSFPIAKIGSYLLNGGSGNEQGDMVFYTTAFGIITEHMRLTGTGEVGVGTTSPDAKLTVNGAIHSKEVKVDISIPVPDYVFEPDYQLTALNELKDYLNKNHHLPEMPSAVQIEKDGINLGDMNMKLLKKVEELTLYLIEQNKQITEQQKINQSLQSQIDQLVKKN